jgi:hypothetical protein
MEKRSWTSPQSSLSRIAEEIYVVAATKKKIGGGGGPIQVITTASVRSSRRGTSHVSLSKERRSHGEH